MVRLPVCFFDNDPLKWGTHFESLPVLAPEPANLASVDTILLASHRAQEIYEQLAALGLEHKVAFDVFDLIDLTDLSVLLGLGPR